MNLLFNFAAFKNRKAIITQSGEHFSYDDLIRECDRFQPFFESRDKKLVMILAKNNIETIIGYLAAVQSNNAAMMIDAHLDSEILNNLISTYQPDFIWRPENGDGVFGYQEYELIDYRWEQQPEIHSDIAVLLSTSGSTGSPKLVRLTKQNVIANARSIAAFLHLNETERAITNLPVHYSYGLSVINSHLTVGATILLTDTPIVKREFWDFFKAEGGTSLTGVPYTYEILKRMGFSQMELPSLRYMTQAGGKLSIELVLEYAELSRLKKFDFWVMYGATEATARIAYLDPAYSVSKSGSIGKSIPGGKLWLEDEEGNPVTDPLLEGELIYEGPNVMMGYGYCREDLAKSDKLLGVLKTGDIGYFDNEGFFYITGRKSRFLKILGKRIGLSDIEHHLQCLGFNCYVGGQDELLLIAYHQEELQDVAKVILNNIKKEVFTRFKIPMDLIQVIPMQHIPRTSSGKINYASFGFKLNQKSTFK
ncbi:AMP-binding protein [Paenibacillus sp. chi10]|uniref:AMP-binding protein n=1 Tax=Paenibacillus suaedae TaxID=3077233 RepID=A0AAJ2JUK1_9BACL|nr:AMP-binding protein [Paenibacillus sp. chi10]MDT8977365.1 AMP-binding protein [Paenibacillus sp. chi10]